MVNDDYLKEHNIKSISIISEESVSPQLLIKLSDEKILRIDVDQFDINNIHNKIISNVEKYEYEIKIKSRKDKVNKIINKLC